MGGALQENDGKGRKEKRKDMCAPKWDFKKKMNKNRDGVVGGGTIEEEGDNLN